MNRFQVILGQLCLAVCALAVGLIVCVVPQFTTALFSGWYADTENSPLTQEELVSFSAVIHDYTFFDQNRTKLYSDIVMINEHIAEEGRASDGQPVITAGDEASVAAAFDAADDAYVLHTDMIDHLDDVSKAVTVIFIICAVFLVVGSSVVLTAYFRGHRSDLAKILRGGGIMTFVICAVFLVWGFIGFDSLFTLMHQVLFEDGTWTFSSSSALICSLPTKFWVAMGALLVAVSAIVGLIYVFLGRQFKNYNI